MAPGFLNSTSRRSLVSLPQESKQVGINPVCVGRGHSVRKARVNLQRCILEDLRRHQTRSTDRNNLIVVSMHDQHRNVDLLQVLREVGLRKGLDAVVMRLYTSEHSLQPPTLAAPF